MREFRTKLSELLSDVADRRDHVLVTRNGKPAAALVPIDEYEALEETAEILSDSATLAAIEAGLADLARGDSVTLDDLRPTSASVAPFADAWPKSFLRGASGNNCSTSTGL